MYRLLMVADMLKERWVLILIDIIPMLQSPLSSGKAQCKAITIVQLSKGTAKRYVVGHAYENEQVFWYNPRRS